MSTDLQIGFGTIATPRSCDSTHEHGDELAHWSNYCIDCAGLPGEKSLCGVDLTNTPRATKDDMDCVVCEDLNHTHTHCAHCGYELE